MSLHPLFLKLGGRRVVLVGGGRVAAEKLPHLLVAGADVTVVSPAMCPDIDRAPVTVVRRAFEPDDLDGAWLAIAAAPPEVNRVVAAAGEARRIFVNVVDDTALATAFASAVLRRGGVTVAVSTEGAAPALAALVRDAIEALLPGDLARWTRASRRLRRDWMASGVPMGCRKPRLLRALNQMYGARP